MNYIMLVTPVTIALLLPLHAHAERALESQACESYIERGTWVYRYSEWTLELTPTECGRQVSSDNTAFMFYEMSKKFGGSPYWVNARGIINQLTCHLVIARDKPTWNLDPWRPYVGHVTTVAVECNPQVPDPEPDFH
jgi:hypothetical protein